MAAGKAHGGRTKLAGKTWFIIVLLALMGQVAWAVENNFFNLFIQDAFGASHSTLSAVKRRRIRFLRGAVGRRQDYGKRLMHSIFRYCSSGKKA